VKLSTDKTKLLNSLIEQQQLLTEQLLEQTKELENTDIFSQNEKLSTALEESDEKIKELKNENEQLKAQLSTTKQALFNKMANEKLNAFLNTQKRIDELYYIQTNNLSSRLKNYETYCSQNIAQAILQIDSYASEQFGDIRQKLEQLNTELEKRIKTVQDYYSEQLQSSLDKNGALGSNLKNEPLQNIEKQSALKQKSFESFVGLNILSKAGILLFLIGIVMLGRYTYIHLSDIFKEGMIFLLGALLIGVGEVFFKKEKSGFSTVLISGGISVLYASAATGYFAFSLYSSRITFLICVAITALAIVLSNQVKSQIVCAFGAVGGYLPVVVSYMISFGKAASDISFMPVSCIWFTLLAVVVFVMSYNKKWHIARYTGYALHLISVGGVASCAWAVKDLNGYSYALPLAAVFSAVSFLIYLLNPSYMIFRKKPLAVHDNILLSLNTVSGAVSLAFCVRNCFYRHGQVADRAVGVVFLIMTLIYAALVVNCIKDKKQNTSFTLNITTFSSLVFSMLVIPFLFGLDYAVIAWALEGVAIAYVSIDKKLTYSEYAGLLCMLIAAVLYRLKADSYEPVLSVISFATVVFSFWIYVVRGLSEKKNNNLYILLEILNGIASVLLLNHITDTILNADFVTIYSRFTENALTLLFGLSIAWIVRKGVLKNRYSLLASDIASLLLVIGVLISNFANYNDVYDFYSSPISDSYISFVNLVLLIIVTVGAEFFFSICAAHFINSFHAPAWLYVIVVSASSLIIITETLIEQFALPFTSVIISAVYIAVACVLLIIGFKKGYTVVRSGGLVLILAAFAKLCFVDTAKLDSGWKIASYFAFGAILITVSYFYQRFAKKLEANAAELIDSESLDKSSEE
jgi:uncharacterized membrane protein